MLVHERLDVAAQRRHEAEVVKDHRTELEDEATQLLQGLVDHLAEGRELLAGSVLVHAVQALADLGLEDDVRHRLRRAVVDLTRDAAALLLLRVHDRLEQLVLVEHGCRADRHRRKAEVRELVPRARDERLHPIEELALGLQRAELALHGEPAAQRRRELVARADECLRLEAGRVGPDLIELLLGHVLTRLEAVHLGLGRSDEEVQLAHLSGDLRLLGGEARDDAGRRLAHHQRNAFFALI